MCAGCRLGADRLSRNAAELSSMEGWGKAGAGSSRGVLNVGRSKEHEQEASRMDFVPLGQAIRRLRRQPHSFCAPELLPAALLDSYADLCSVLRTETTVAVHSLHGWPLLPGSCAKGEPLMPSAPGRTSRRTSVLPERFDLARVTAGRNHSVAHLGNDARRRLGGHTQLYSSV